MPFFLLEQAISSNSTPSWKEFLGSYDRFQGVLNIFSIAVKKPVGLTPRDQAGNMEASDEL
jgi:hypothetical protein